MQVRPEPHDSVTAGAMTDVSILPQINERLPNKITKGYIACLKLSESLTPLRRMVKFNTTVV
jgi:hypothetical protein